MSADPLLSRTNLRNAATFDRSTELFEVVTTSTNADEIGQALEAAASDSDLAHALLYRLLVLARGWDAHGDPRTGVEIVAAGLNPNPADLWTPEP